MVFPRSLATPSNSSPLMSTLNTAVAPDADPESIDWPNVTEDVLEDKAGDSLAICLAKYDERGRRTRTRELEAFMRACEEVAWKRREEEEAARKRKEAEEAKHKRREEEEAERKHQEAEAQRALQEKEEAEQRQEVGEAQTQEEETGGTMSSVSCIFIVSGLLLTLTFSPTPLLSIRRAQFASRQSENARARPRDAARHVFHAKCSRRGVTYLSG